ncbi:hydrolase 1, exosortase A system-associated [Sphingomonas bacterium]|uniref:hydrolase 1, exosortase A system-associated n=1 Tax=Sphingomonas bacterium TaxID=1895847 RepID=UPI001575D4B4|nr:hydrolase 1, exosortase A system-associated [Sphingomonas bacterium]
MRRPLIVPCEGASLVATLDEAAGATGLLIVSGGNEVRAGAHRGMALLAALLAADDVPVFRFDRRGVGDSGGANGGYASSAPDIAAAAAAFRREQPQITRLVGFGNCDAATALAMFGRAAGIDALVLGNPWLVERGAGDMPPPAAIRARYAGRLATPRQWWRLLSGQVDLRKLLKGLRSIARTSPQPSLAARFLAGVTGIPTTIVLATGDSTALAARAALRSLRPVPMMKTVTIPTDSHSFARTDDAAALEAAIRAALAG